MSKFTCLFISLLFSLNLFADDMCSVYFHVVNSITYVKLKTQEATITYYKVGDTKVDTAYAQSWDPPTFGIEVPKSGGQYKITIEAKGFTTTTHEIVIKPFRALERSRIISPLRIAPAPKVRKLGEAEVRATRVKFFYKGDTLVYDADAFNTAEGSMLDALIKQLPGVDLKPSGEITVNGKRIDDLLLNGERFFNNDRQLMLENLPAYTVKNISVYNKAGLMSRIYGKGYNDTTYVMDVKLKKEYSIGWIGNVEAGYGTKERYLARLFAMRYTDCSRLTFVANLNNLNDNRKPGQDSYWTPEAMPKGLLSTKMGGVDYLVRHRKGAYRLEGSIIATYSDADNYQENTGETYLQTGNWFTKSKSQNRSERFNLTWSGSAEMKCGSHLYVRAAPSASYYSSSNDGYGLSATFMENPYKQSAANLLDSIACIGGSDIVRRLALNRQISISKAHSDGGSFSMPIYYYNVCPALGNLTMFSDFGYKTSSSRTYQQQLIDFHASSQAKPSDYRDMFVRSSPDREVSYNAGVSYGGLQFSKQLSMSLTYSFGQEFKKNDYLNSLSRIEGWLADTASTLLPSEVEFKQRTVDAQNSYDMRQTTNTHNPSAWIGYNGVIWASLSLGAKFQHYRLDYYRGDHATTTLYDGVTNKNCVLYNANLTAHKSIKRGNHFVYPELFYTLTQNAPSMTSLLDIENNSDPLNIYHGNAGLKKSTYHDAKLNISYIHSIDGKTDYSLYPAIFFNVAQNAIAYGYTYDASTGVRNYTPQNINGNYQVGASGRFNRNLDKKGRLALSSTMEVSYAHGVDLIGEDNASSHRSSVKTWRGSERLSLDYRLGKNTIGAKGFVSTGRSSSEREGFQTVSQTDFNYGLTGLLNLPLGLQLSTDLTMYSRRGYVNRAANTDDLVWNARLAKKLPKKKLTFMLDAFDILGQLSNTTYVMNSQGRTESYFNALPRYVMFHVIYNFAKSPKKLAN